MEECTEGVKLYQVRYESLYCVCPTETCKKHENKHLTIKVFYKESLCLNIK